MFRFAGQIVGTRRSPYIYFIKKERYLYIGETQDLPVRRWGEHILAGGTFWKRLGERDEEALESGAPISFWAYSCDKLVEEAFASEWKRASQFIEQTLHVLVLTKRKRLWSSLDVISDTSRTTPYRGDVPCWIGDLAVGIFDVFAADWERSLVSAGVA